MILLALVIIVFHYGLIAFFAISVFFLFRRRSLLWLILMLLSGAASLLSYIWISRGLPI